MTDRAELREHLENEYLAAGARMGTSGFRAAEQALLEAELARLDTSDPLATDAFVRRYRRELRDGLHRAGPRPAHETRQRFTEEVTAALEELDRALGVRGPACDCDECPCGHSCERRGCECDACSYYCSGTQCADDYCRGCPACETGEVPRDVDALSLSRRVRELVLGAVAVEESAVVGRDDHLVLSPIESGPAATARPVGPGLVARGPWRRDRPLVGTLWESLDRSGHSSVNERGRRLARAGHVHDLVVEPHRVEALVVGSGTEVYRTRLDFPATRMSAVSRQLTPACSCPSPLGGPVRYTWCEHTVAVAYVALAAQEE